MLLRNTGERLVLCDQPIYEWLTGVACFFTGPALAVSCWILSDELRGRKLLLARGLGSVIGTLLVAAAVLLWTKYPFTRATFDRTARMLRIRRWPLDPESWDIPFQSIESISLAQRKDDGGDISYRITIGTRGGNRIPLSPFKRHAEHLREMVRIADRWIRIAKPEGREMADSGAPLSREAASN